MKATRKPLGKTIRFSVFRRDKFTCRYCGRNSDTAVLEVDHVIPVSRGGTSEMDNLITSCADCNGGKGARPLDAPAPTESDRLMLAQERQEIMAAAKLAKKAAKARAAFRQEMCNFWCEANRQDSVNKSVLSAMCNLATTHGVERVYEWIQIAADRFTHHRDNDKSRYIFGIRRRLSEQGEL